MEVFKKECTVKIEPFIVELCGALYKNYHLKWNAARINCEMIKVEITFGNNAANSLTANKNAKTIDKKMRHVKCFI